MSVKPFAEHGHYTAVHDAVFDVVMPFCPPNAFKVLLFVLRKTRGWKKDEDVLRYAEIKKGTGIKSDATLAKELEWLLEKKLLNARDESGKPHKKGSRKAPAYSLNRDFELKVGAPDATSENEVSATSENEASNNHPSQETDYEANASRPKPKNGEPSALPMEKYITDRMYDAYKAAGYPRWTQDEYGYHMGRVLLMLKENDPTEEELEDLPDAFMNLYTRWNPKADAILTLRAMRRDRKRENGPQAVNANTYGVTPEERERQTERNTKGCEEIFSVSGGADEPAEPFDKEAMLAEMRGEGRAKEKAGAA